MRVLRRTTSLDTPAGHVAVGWLIVEDILTVLVLVLIPALGQARASGTPDGPEPSLAAGVALALAQAGGARGRWCFVLGSRLIPWVLVRVARLRSRELFTLTVLVIAIAIAAGASAAVRRVDGARGVPRRHGGGPVAGQPAGRGRRAAAARRLRRAVLRVGRDAVRPLVPAARAAPAAGGARDRPDRQAAGRARGRRGARLLGAHGARRGARASRRSASSRSSSATWRASRGCSRTGAQPARRLRARLDHAEPVPVPRARPARGRAAALGLALAAAQPRERGPRRGRERRDGQGDRRRAGAARGRRRLRAGGPARSTGAARGGDARRS